MTPHQDDWAELERVARAAADLVPPSEGDTWFLPEHLTRDDRFAKEDAAFIAAAGPAAILQLIAAARGGGAASLQNMQRTPAGSPLYGEGE